MAGPLGRGARCRARCRWGRSSPSGPAPAARSSTARSFTALISRQGIRPRLCRVPRSAATRRLNSDSGRARPLNGSPDEPPTRSAVSASGVRRGRVADGGRVAEGAGSLRGLGCRRGRVAPPASRDAGASGFLGFTLGHDQWLWPYRVVSRPERATNVDQPGGRWPGSTAGLQGRRASGFRVCGLPGRRASGFPGFTLGHDQWLWPYRVVSRPETATSVDQPGGRCRTGSPPPSVAGPSRPTRRTVWPARVWPA